MIIGLPDFSVQFYLKMENNLDYYSTYNQRKFICTELKIRMFLKKKKASLKRRVLGGRMFVVCRLSLEECNIYHHTDSMMCSNYTRAGTFCAHLVSEGNAT